MRGQVRGTEGAGHTGSSSRLPLRVSAPRGRAHTDQRADGGAGRPPDHITAPPPGCP